MISYIDSIHKDGDDVFVRAMVEDMVLVYPQTMQSPAEYGPAMCEAVFFLDEEETIPDDEKELVKYIDNLDLEWRIVDDY
jgi:hypothetical protein